MIQSRESDFPGLPACVAKMRSGDQLEYEDGWHWLDSRAHEFIDELLELSKNEPNQFVRIGFIELLGSTRSRKVIGRLQEAANTTDREMVLFAALALEALPFPEANQLALEVRANNPGFF